MQSSVIDPAILGARGDSNALKQILRGDSESARSVRAGLERRGIDFAKARAITLFGKDSRPGATGEFTVSRDGLPIVAAPGAPIKAGGRDTTTPGHGDCVHVGRAQIGVITSTTRSPIQKDDRSCPRRGHHKRDRNRSRGRQARWTPEAPAGARRPLPALRSREDASTCVMIFSQRD